jgi:hypothetical protein
LRHAAALCGCIFALYLTFSSAYLMFANHWLDYRLRSQTKAAEASMLVRRDLEIYRARIDNMQSAVAPWPPLWAVWAVFLDLKAIGVSFRAVNVSGASATYYMTAERATDVLDWLTRDARIATAEFSLPVRNVRNAEQFAIAVTFNVLYVPDIDTIEEDLEGNQLASARLAADKPLVKQIQGEN